jgi:prepilin-type N-terminal cleavage/methylation domain-containing protein
MADTYRLSRLHSRAGFTLLEVLIAILVASLFFLLALQATSTGTFSKARALESSQVLKWIQNDVETLKYTASTYQLTKLTSSVGSGASLIPVASSADFKEGDNFRIATDTGDSTIYSVTSPQENAIGVAPPLKQPYDANNLVAIVSNKVATFLGSTDIAGSKKSQVTVTSTNGIQTQSELNLGATEDPTVYSVEDVKGPQTLEVSPKLKKKTQVPGSTSVNVVRCDAATKQTGLADGLRDRLMSTDESADSSVFTIDTAKTKTATGKQFTIQRTVTVVNSAPFNLLQVSYNVTPPDGTPSPIKTFVTRVLPEVAFYCQQ